MPPRLPSLDGRVHLPKTAAFLTRRPGLKTCLDSPFLRFENCRIKQDFGGRSRKYPFRVSLSVSSPDPFQRRATRKEVAPPGLTTRRWQGTEGEVPVQAHGGDAEPG